MLPPCLVNAANMDDTEMCEQVTDCTSDLKAYALSGYTTAANTLTVLGIAKDGHLIVGPYDSTGNVFDCSTLDQCGGIELENGNYVYVYQNVFPYAIGCFGPA